MTAKVSKKTIALAKAKWDRELKRCQDIQTVMFDLDQQYRTQNDRLHQAYLDYKALTK